jgi:SAM-dependent methyltransferase
MQGLISWLTRFVPRHVLQRWTHWTVLRLAWVWSGQRFEDPITGKTYRKMLPYGRVISRPNALAPHSLSLERHRAVWCYLQRYTDFFQAPARMLHLAPEYCFLVRWKRLPQLEYVTGDLNSPWADHHFDVHQIPFPNDHFDLLMANHLLEHVRDDHAVLREMYRVLKPGGWGILQVPIDYSTAATAEDPTITDPAVRERLYWQRDHVRLYGYEDYPERLRKAGFEVSCVDLEEMLGSALFERYALAGERWIYRVRKI